MLRFDKAELLRELDKLPVRARAAFAAACAERLLSAFEGKGTASIREVLAHLWAHITDDTKGSGSLNEDLALSLSLLPDEQDALDEGQPYAADAVAGLIYAIKTRLSGSSQDAMWAGQRVYDAVDHAVMSRLNTSLIGQSEEAAVIADPVVQSELARQHADLEELKIATKNHTTLDAAIARLRARATADAQALFSRDITPGAV